MALLLSKKWLYKEATRSVKETAEETAKNLARDEKHWLSRLWTAVHPTIIQPGTKQVFLYIFGPN